MNSSQRRKAEAEKHNALLIENEAYQEDRLRDPEKYKQKLRTSSTRNDSRMSRAAILYSIGAITGY